MEEQRRGPGEEHRSGMEVIPPAQEQAEPTVRESYISVWISREVDSRTRARSILLSALIGLASAVAVALFLALALTSGPLGGALAAVALFAAIRHAQFRRARRALRRANR